MSAESQRSSLLPALAISAAALLAAPGAHAWGNLLLIDAPPAAGTFAAGPSLWKLPRYPGSSRSETSLLPGLDWYGANGFFASTDTGLGWNLAPGKDTQAGLRLWPQLGRRAADASPGLEAVGPRVQLEAFANHAPFDALLLQSGLLAGAGQHHNGLQMEIGVTSGIPLGPDLLGIGVSATYANAAFRQSYFGIRADAAAAGSSSTRTSAALGSGWNDTSVTLSFEHKFNQQWRFDAQWIRALLSRETANGSAGLQRRQRIQDAGTMSLWRQF